MGILVLFGTSLLIFTIARVVPGDVATIALGARATEAAKEALRMEMNLYDPFPVQYVKWLTSAVTGNFGNSFVTKRPVAMDVAQFLPATLELIIMAGVFMVIGTFILGLLAGKYKNTWVDGLIRSFIILYRSEDDSLLYEKIPPRLQVRWDFSYHTGS